jgi:hypothetical protein
MKIIKVMKNDIYVPDMVKTFQLPESSLSKHCLEVIADVLGAEKKSFDDDYDITILENIVIEKYKEVLESFSKENSHGFKTSFSVSGVSLNFGWGDEVWGAGYGINGAKTYEQKENDRCVILDVEHLYASLMIKYGFLSRCVSNPEIFEEIYKKKTDFDKNGVKYDPIAVSYRVVVNGTYGAMSINEDNPLYDVRQVNNICINGQLFMLDLIEKLEHSGELLHVNTDRLIYKVNDYSVFKNECEKWSERTKLNLKLDEISNFNQKGLFHYEFTKSDGTKIVKEIFKK